MTVDPIEAAVRAEVERETVITLDVLTRVIVPAALRACRGGGAAHSVGAARLETMNEIKTYHDALHAISEFHAYVWYCRFGCIGVAGDVEGALRAYYGDLPMLPAQAKRAYVAKVRTRLSEKLRVVIDVDAMVAAAIEARLGK